MALIKCPNCQKDVSSMVTYCPFCNTDLTQFKVSAAESGDYYNPDAGFSYPHPDDWQASENHEAYREQGLKFEELPSKRRNTSGNSEGRSNPANTISGAETPQRRSRRQAPPGRRLLGYRAGQPLYMLVSICYHMAACVGILYALSLSPQYLADGTLLFHLCRVFLAAAMLLLPALLLSENSIRRNLPLLGSRNKTVMAIGFFILYLLLAILFLFSWYYCL